MSRLSTLAIAVVAVVSTTACTNPDSAKTSKSATTGQQAGTDYEVRLLFDGGYAFLRDDAKETLTIASFHVPGEKDTIMAHGMRMRLRVGNQVNGTKPDIDKTWNLEDHAYDVSIADYGSTPSGVKLPESSPFDADPCKPIGEGTREANNLALLPNLSDLAKLSKTTDTIDLDRKRYHNRVMFTKGTMQIEKTTSCFEFTQGTTGLAKHRVPNGLGGTVVTFQLKDHLKLQLTDDTGATSVLEFEPDTTGTGKREIELYFGRFAPECKEGEAGCVIETGKPLADFDRFYTLLVKPPVAKDRIVLINRSPAGDVTPRSQCPSALIKIN